MANVIVVGAQWGDEGKGKVVDLLSEKADGAVRGQGGANAGHTIVIGEEKYVLHQIPSSALQGKWCVIGPGVVLDLPALEEELQLFPRIGRILSPRLFMISPDAMLILPTHRMLDKHREASAGKGRIGTTGKGIGPCYEDATARRGVSIGEVLYAPTSTKERFIALLNRHYKELGEEHSNTHFEEEWQKLVAQAERFRPFVTDTVEFLAKCRRAGKRVILEGAQGALLDNRLGTRPYVTSSSTVTGGLYAGAGMAPGPGDRVWGVVKAYTTRVGEGPFPTEDLGELGEYLRSTGKEFGATTGRPRRCGPLDLALLRRTIDTNGIQSIAFTKLDVLTGVDPIPVCIGYRLDGQLIEQMPSTSEELGRCIPVYRELPGWIEPLDDVNSWERLPKAARHYVEWVGSRLHADIRLLSVGPARHQTFFLD